MIQPFNPFVYFRYLFSSNKTRTAQMMNVLLPDGFCATIIRDLESYGYDISYPFFGLSGAYRPLLVSANIKNFDKAFMDKHQNDEFKAKFSMSPRYGLGQNAFYFIHELVHFKQDLEGRLQIDDPMALECEAALESIKAAYRLGGVVWQGALSSLDWGRLAKSYAQSEDEKALKRLWQERHQKYYERKKITSAQDTVSAAHMWNRMRV